MDLPHGVKINICLRNGKDQMKNSVAFVEERRSRILDILKNERNATVLRISNELRVSEITIRRDLDALAQSGRIIRFRGGARIAPGMREHFPHFSDKQSANMQKKDRIGKRAAELLADDDVVFMNSGTTVLSVLKHISRNNVRVITNNAMAPSVERGAKVSVILTGGECCPETQSLYGDFAMSNISKVYATKCILGANGIMANVGITTSIHQETTINNMMLSRCSGKRIVVADSSKIGRSVDFLSAEISLIDCLVTDSAADPVEVQRLENIGVEVILVDENGAFL